MDKALALGTIRTKPYSDGGVMQAGSLLDLGDLKRLRETELAPGTELEVFVKVASRSGE